MPSRRVDIKAILADPILRAKLLAAAVDFICNLEQINPTGVLERCARRNRAQPVLPRINRLRQIVARVDPGLY